jgi:hypothetical protein
LTFSQGKIIRNYGIINKKKWKKKGDFETDMREEERGGGTPFPRGAWLGVPPSLFFFIIITDDEEEEGRGDRGRRGNEGKVIGWGRRPIDKWACGPHSKWVFNFTHNFLTI